MDFNKLGKRIREERKKYNLTQETFSEKLDLSDSYIGQVERGQRGVTLQNLVKIANVLGVSVDYLLTDSLCYKEDQYLEELMQILQNRTDKEKKMAVDVLKTMFVRFDETKNNL